ncbi:hypothetical protein [Lactiplantibacillus mudanjiangensis]|uniref:hypothetical protein n=1 Tax=Lactiplantibacillus mudanjiangensis TaxID=1296538 RepID=UPI0013EF5ACB|nr:hypothetical protein [Lactiplantibacillus mudanjiangensis]
MGAPIGQVVFLGVANVVEVSWSWLGFTIGCGLIVLFIIFGTSQMKEPALIDD